MVTRENIDNLLTHIRNLEKLAIEIREKETLPASFFSQAFEMSGQIMNSLRTIEQGRIEQIEGQLEKQLANVELITARIKSEEEKLMELMAIQESQMEETIQESAPEPEVVEVIPELPVVEVKEEPLPTPSPVVSVPSKTEQVSTTGRTIQEEKPAMSLKEIFEKKNLTDFKKSFSLNDRFLFKKELFGGDEAKMTKVINDLNEMTSLQDAKAYITVEMNWDRENPFVMDFVSRLEKRYN